MSPARDARAAGAPLGRRAAARLAAEVAAPDPRVPALVALLWALLVALAVPGGWTDLGATAHRVADALAWAPRWAWGAACARLAWFAGTAVLATGWLAVGWGWGRPAGRWCAPRLPAPLAAAVGFAALSLAATGLGCAGLLFAGPVRLLAAAGLAAGLAAAWRRRADVVAAAGAFRALDIAPAAALACGFAAWCALAALPDTLEDPLVYHWAAPEHFLRHHALLAAPQHVQWHNPLLVEMLYAVALPVGGVAAVKAANLALMLATLGLAGALARRLGAGGAGWIAAAALAVSPAVAEQVWLAKNDLGLMMFYAAAFLAPLVAPLDTTGGAILAGACAGWCAAVKYTAAFPLAGLAVWLAWHRPRRGSMVRIALAAGLVWAPWPWRNWIGTGNPVFAYGTRHLGGLWWGPELETAVHHYIAAVTPAACMTSAYWRQVWHDALADPAAFGPVLAALGMPALFLTLPPAAALAVPAAVAAFMLLLTERNARFLLPLAVLAAAGAEGVAVRLRAASPRVGVAALAVLLGLGAVETGYRTVRALPGADLLWLAGQATTPALQQRQYTGYEDLRQWMAAHLPRDARVLLYGENRRFGFTQPVVSTHIVVEPPPWRWAKESFTPAGLAKKWRQAGAEYVAYNLVQARYRQVLWYRGPEWDARALAVYCQFGLRYLTPVYRSPTVDGTNGLLYLLRVDARPHAPAAFLPVLPWAATNFFPAYVASKQGKVEEGVRLARALLPPVRDIGECIEMAAHCFHAAQQYGDAVALNRRLLASGYTGESCWIDLAGEESFLGRQRDSFAALRLELLRSPGTVEGTGYVAATTFYNQAVRDLNHGRRAAACGWLRTALLASPALQLAHDMRRDLGCP